MAGMSSSVRRTGINRKADGNRISPSFPESPLPPPPPSIVSFPESPLPLHCLRITLAPPLSYSQDHPCSSIVLFPGSPLPLHCLVPSITLAPPLSYSQNHPCPSIVSFPESPLHWPFGSPKNVCEITYTQ